MATTNHSRAPRDCQHFKADLDQFLKDTLAKNYSGKGSPRIVLFSPAADEKHPDPNFPDPTATNANLAAYTAAMEEVAAANHVLFVDLFSPSARSLHAGCRQRQARSPSTAITSTMKGTSSLPLSCTTRSSMKSLPTATYRKASIRHQRQERRMALALSHHRRL